MSNKYFNKALTDFTIDFASGEAIRNLADKGYTISEIYKKLDFPTPMGTIKEIVWKHFLNKGIISLTDPVLGEKKEQVTYEKVQDNYGRVSFKQVVIEDESEPGEYIACNFGRMFYKDKKGFTEALEVLSESDRNYILELPWPLETVWHVKNERMSGIESKLPSLFEQGV